MLMLSLTRLAASSWRVQRQDLVETPEWFATISISRAHRAILHYGRNGEEYMEAYPAVAIGSRIERPYSRLRSLSKK